MASPIKGRQPPEKEFYIFKKPMIAKDRAENFLGVAFEDPRLGSQGKYTPQGPGKTQVGDGGHAGTLTYWAACDWPRNLVDDIYPRDPTTATGVEVILENIKEGHIHTKIMEAITFALGVGKKSVDKAVIPVFKRYSMDDAYRKICDLLDNETYRERIIKLFEKQEKKKKVLYIATNLMVCGALSHEQVKQEEQELQTKAKDPTEHAPVEFDGQMHHIKRSTLKGTYQSDVLLAMSYRRILYERVKKDNTGLLSRILGTQQRIMLSGKAVRFERTDGDVDAFWIDDFEFEGEAASWMGSKDQDPDLNRLITPESSGHPEDKKQPALPEDITVYDAAQGNDLGVETYPVGFFDQSDSEE